MIWILRTWMRPVEQIFQTTIRRCQSDGKSLWFAGILIMALPLLFACGGSSNGGGGDTTISTGDIAGIWHSEETVSGNCSDEQYPRTDYETYQVSQSGNTLTITIQSSSNQAIGSINGNRVTWEGVFPDGDGTLSIQFSGTLVSENRISGSGTWEWSNGSYSCSGTTQISASKEVQEAQFDASGFWQGSWNSNSYGLNGDFSVAITQQGATLTGTISVPGIGIENEPLKGTASGGSIVFGDINDRIVFSGDLGDANTALGTYEYPGIVDNGIWNATRSDL